MTDALNIYRGREMCIERETVDPEIADSDVLVRSEIAQLIDRLKCYGRTLPDVRYLGKMIGRYDHLIDMIADSVHDTIGNGDDR